MGEGRRGVSERKDTLRTPFFGEASSPTGLGGRAAEYERGGLACERESVNAVLKASVCKRKIIIAHACVSAAMSKRRRRARKGPLCSAFLTMFIFSCV